MYLEPREPRTLIRTHNDIYVYEILKETIDVACLLVEMDVSTCQRGEAESNISGIIRII